MKKRYSKKRNQLKSVKRYGAGKADIFEKELAKYVFLAWLDPYIRLRNDTKTNLSVADEHMPSDNEIEIENYEDWFDDESNISTECKNKKPKIKEIESDVIKRRCITDEGTT